MAKALFEEMAGTMFEYCSLIREAIQTLDLLFLRDAKNERSNTENMDNTESKITKALVNTVTFEIASFCVDHSDHCSDSNPLYKALKSTSDRMNDGRDYGCDPGIIWLILDFVFVDMGKWNRTFQEQGSNSQILESFEYQWNNKLVRYKAEPLQSLPSPPPPSSAPPSPLSSSPPPQPVAVHVPSGFEINPSDYDDGGQYRFVVHLCCLNTMDNYNAYKMWIGLQRKSEFQTMCTKPSETSDAVILTAGRCPSNYHDDSDYDSDDDNYSALGETVELRSGKVGTIRFIGPVHFATGNWIGIELHDHFGPNDGAVRGVRYFTCPKKRGIFVKVIKGRVAMGTAIYRNKVPVAQKLQSWTTGDWISMMLTIKGSTLNVQFYLNGDQIGPDNGKAIVIENGKEADPLMLYALVDADDYTWYIEQAFTTQALNPH